MSDYMFMLENHLNAEQSSFASALQAICDEANWNVFLAGGAMRDMLGGFPIRDLDFVIEGNAVKTAKSLAASTGAQITATDELRKVVEMTLPAGSTVSVGMSRSEKYVKAGGKAHVAPASIHEDLRCRDFTINSIALSLGKASKGLLLDPMNGLADLERREVRAVHNYVLYDDPIRIWRMIRLKVRLGFAIEERTASQYANAREAEMEKHIGPRALYEQLRHIANEANPADVLKALDEEKLLGQVSPALTGQKLNLQGFSKLLKTRQLVPFGADFSVDNFALLLYLVTERLAAKEVAGLVKGLAMERAGVGGADRARGPGRPRRRHHRVRVGRAHRRRGHPRPLSRGASADERPREGDEGEGEEPEVESERELHPGGAGDGAGLQVSPPV